MRLQELLMRRCMCTFGDCGVEWDGVRIELPLERLSQLDPRGIASFANETWEEFPR